MSISETPWKPTRNILILIKITHFKYQPHIININRVIKKINPFLSQKKSQHRQHND